MFAINDNFTKLPSAYLFSEVARRVRAYSEANPGEEILRLGIGDVTRPLCPAVVEALHRGVDDEARTETFHGYGPEQGHEFLTALIAEHDYRRRGIAMSQDEIFVSDGAKSDTGNIGDILSAGNRVAVTDPVYPVYVDTNVMAGRAGHLLPSGRWSDIEYLSQQSDRHHPDARRAEDMGGLLPPRGGVAAVRRRIRGLRDTPRGAAVHL